MLRMPPTANSIQLSYPELLAFIMPMVPRCLLSNSRGSGIGVLERANDLMGLAVFMIAQCRRAGFSAVSILRDSVLSG
jgi:hypothetical protein